MNRMRHRFIFLFFTALSYHVKSNLYMHKLAKRNANSLFFYTAQRNLFRKIILVYHHPLLCFIGYYLSYKPSSVNSLKPKERALDLLLKMSLDEKMAQVNCLFPYEESWEELASNIDHGIGQVCQGRVFPISFSLSPHSGVSGNIQYRC